MYRPDGPAAFRPVGEVQFANAVAEDAANGPVQACAAVVGCADLAMGDDVAAGTGRPCDRRSGAPARHSYARGLAR